jgi:hypothetical protein
MYQKMFNFNEPNIQTIKPATRSIQLNENAEKNKKLILEKLQ